ncbi:MAG: PD-(D/E)XK nuclease family protein [Ignavibacteriae bacterium]|nr:PD-(D/E)XK nuclease family protein [Ignavibacteriota bacterium]
MRDDLKPLQSFGDIIEKYAQIPRVQLPTTYLGLCRYPGWRFEEVTSRILQFYFTPANEHRLGDTLIRALLDAVAEKDDGAEGLPRLRDAASYNDAFARVEVDAEGKRIDLVIQTHAGVIGIENKITASLYNDLSVYRKRLRPPALCIVLSVFDITDPSEKNRMNETGFVGITYCKFFAFLKPRLGAVTQQADTKLLIHLYDFITEIENRRRGATMENELFDFYCEHQWTIWEMNEKFQTKYVPAVARKLEGYLSKLELLRKQDESCATISKFCDWRIWQKQKIEQVAIHKDLRIGIEGYFTKNHGCPPQFSIFLRTWDEDAWKHYQSLYDEMNAVASKEWPRGIPVPSTVSTFQIFLRSVPVTIGGDTANDEPVEEDIDNVAQALDQVWSRLWASLLRFTARDETQSTG